MGNKLAVITGISGQDASYLSELLLSKDYNVIGINRRTSGNNISRLSNCIDNPKFNLIEGDLCDSNSINNIIHRYKPDEFYNLAAQSHVATSFSQPTYTFDVNAKGPLLILEAIHQYSKHTKFYQASTSEMFGSNYSTKINGTFVGMQPEADSFGYINRSEEKYQDESTSLCPNSPYAVAKVAAHNLVRIYRDAYNIHASAGILFNHESERRGENFVTRKITKYIGSLANSNDILQFPSLKLGNIDAVRDWGHARDYIEAMWRMLQQNKPDDYIIGTGEGYTVKEFLIEAFSLIGLNWEDFVEIDPSLYRPCEVPYLRCDPSKAKKVLGWKANTTFKELVKLMVESDINEQKNKKG